MFCCSVSVCRPSRQKGCEAGRPAGVVFRGHRARPPVKRPSEGDRAKQAERSAAEKDLKTARIYSTHIRVSGRNWRDSWHPHEACQGSILPPVSTIPDAECSGMKARASGSGSVAARQWSGVETAGIGGVRLSSAVADSLRKG